MSNPDRAFALHREAQQAEEMGLFFRAEELYKLAAQFTMSADGSTVLLDKAAAARAKGEGSLRPGGANLGEECALPSNDAGGSTAGVTARSDPQVESFLRRMRVR